MSIQLQRHPESEGGTGLSLRVRLAPARPGLLRLAYELTGEVAHVRLPTPAEPRRADELWRTTCFEAFVRDPDGGYLEFNFAPSRAWAVYRFDGYRSGMAPAEGFPAPSIKPRQEVGRYVLKVELDLASVLAHPLSQRLRLGLSAVIEDWRGEILLGLGPPGG
jgi:hypothetical protein